LNRQDAKRQEILRRIARFFSLTAGG